MDQTSPTKVEPTRIKPSNSNIYSSSSTHPTSSNTQIYDKLLNSTFSSPSTLLTPPTTTLTAFDHVITTPSFITKNTTSITSTQYLPLSFDSTQGLNSMYLQAQLSFSNSFSCTTLAYIDSGASGGNYISKSFAEANQIPMIPSTSIIVSGFTGASSTKSSFVTTLVTLKIGLNHSEQIVFNVLDESRHDLLLGYDWLFLHNPSIDWKVPSMTFCRCYCNGLPSSIPVLGQPLSIPPPSSPIISRPPLPAARRSLPTEEYDDDSDDEDNAETDILSLLPLTYHQFADVFSEKAANLLPEHRPFDCSIELTDPNSIPPYRPIYSLSPLETSALDSYIDENLAKGYIRRSNSPSGAPIFFVKKKSGDLRPCVDFTALNAMTIKNRGPLPLINDLLERLGSAKVFSKFDLRGAYNLVRVKPGDEWKTAFRCHRGLFEYLVMPFGLTNAPAIFQKMMNTIFSDILDIFVIVYLDDILVFSSNIEDHRDHVSIVLSRLRKHNLFAKLSKCSFEQDHVEFLGHSVSSYGISPLPEKVSSVIDWPVPTNVKQVQQFVGFTNYYRRFISNYSLLAAPLTNLTKKDTPFLWSESCSKSFHDLKSAISSGPVLRHADPNLPFTLETDASNFAIGAVLYQPAPENPSLLHPVAFYSKKLEPAEINYDVHDKELLAIICSLEHWRHHLVGSPFKISILCDHKNLIFFQARRHLKSRHARWATRLSPFQFTLSYRPGASNDAADALSRRSDYAFSEGEDGVDTKSCSETFTLLDKNLFIDSVSSQPSLPFTRIQVTDPELKLNIMKSRHDSPSAGHQGRLRTFDLIAREYYWEGMRKEISDYVDRCDTCQRNKSPRHKPFGLLQPLPIPFRPWSSISMDFIVKLPKSKGFDSIFVVVCRLTKQSHFIPCKESMNSSDLADLFIANIFKYHGLPDDIISDRGPVFRSKFWISLLSKLKVTSKLSSAFHPETDGQTERVNQCLEQYLRCYINYSQDDWVTYLPIAEFSYNNSMSTSTKQSPFYANYGFHPRMEYNIEPESSVPAVSSHISILNELMPILKDELKLAQQKMKSYADKSRLEHPFKVGDYVWLLNRNIRSSRPSQKLDHKRLGPFKIIKAINSVTFELELPESYRIANCFHTSLLEPVSEEYLKNMKPSLQPVIIDSHEEYYVDKILDMKQVDGRTYYLVKWYGYSDSDNTWEPVECLTGCEELLSEFNQTLNPILLSANPI